ncbi:PAS domain S-box protein [Pontibacter harenae]|uniref:PAS domain S-box protein n=1 Tax=Pontibacter harenae TaxID=2894083 RepID=UPI001E639CBD|nr:PAS domain S-box protein [Pontibacter harenae]MCC9168409.1 PAS domain S-box protein [Pontibacter harenae]
MDRIREIVSAMHKHENQILSKRKRQSDEIAFQTNIVLFSSLGILIFLLTLVLRKGWKNLEEKKIAGEELIRHEKHFRALVENNNEAIILRDNNSNITYWSPATEKILGWALEEFKKIPLKNHIHPDDLPAIKSQWQQVLENPDKPVKGLTRALHKAGHYIWLEGETTNLLHQESVQAIVYNFRDVSDRIKADQEVQTVNALLAKAINNLRRIMDSSLDVICTIDAQGKFVQVSAASAWVWGYAPEDLIGQAYMDFVAEQDKKLTSDIAASIMNGNLVTTFENHYLRPDGSFAPILWSASYNTEDQIMYCVAKDATEKKNLEKAFRGEQKRFNELFIQAPSSICILKGSAHEVVSKNTYYDALTDNRVINGQPIKVSLPEIEQQGFLKILDQVYETGEPFVGHEMQVFLNGKNKAGISELYLNTVFQPYTSAEDKVEGIFFYGVDVTEQVQNRLKIEESERNFRQLIQDLPAAIYTCETSGKIKLYNKAAVELWGREPDLNEDRWCGSYKISDTNHQVIHQTASPMAQALQNGEPVYGQEIIIERPNGEKRYVMPHPVISYDAAGNITGGINILVDMTERRIASELIQKSEAALAEAQHIAKIGSWNLEIPSQRLTVSQELYLVFEADTEGFDETLVSFLNFVNEADRDVAIQITQKAINDGEPFSADYRINTGKGNHRVISVIGKCALNASNEVIRLYGTAQDVTEQRKFEHDLQASEEKYKLLFYQAPLPKWIYNLETLEILDVNESAINHYGYSRDEFIKLHARDLRPAEEAAYLEETLNKAKTQKSIMRYGLWNHLKKDGTQIKVEVSAHHIVYDNIPSLIVEANDVTEKVKAELALKISNHRWETLSKVSYDGIWDWDLITNELFWGDNMKTLFGHEIENSRESYKQWIDHLHPEDRDRVVNDLEAFLQSGEATWQQEYRYKKADGSFAYCTDRGILIRDENNLGYRMIGAIRDITQNKLAQENLLIEKTFSDSLLEATPDGMVGFNSEGTILLFNKKAEDIFGYTQDEILGMDIQILLPADEHAAHINRREAFFANPSEQKTIDNSRELIVIRKNQEEFPADLRLNLLKSHKGTIIVCSVRDITQRKLREIQLKQSEKNLKAIMSSTQEAMYLLDLNLNLLLLNEHAHVLAKKTYGIDCRLGDCFPDLFEPELSDGLKAIYQKVLAGDNWETERVFEMPEGDENYYSSYFPVRDDDSNIIGICCASKNITERKRIEAAVKIAQSDKEEFQYRFKAILDYSPQAILIKDMEGKHIFSNKAFLNLFDLDRNNEISLQLKAMFDDDLARAEFGVNDGNVEDGEIKSKEFKQQIRLQEGKILEMEVIKFPLYDRKKKFFGICTLCKDITEQVQHEQQLVKARENAEHLQEQFLANMSHELRTPMNGIVGMVNLLLTSSSLQPDQHGRLNIIKRSSDTLLNLVNDILDLSKIKAGMLTIENINFDFNESVTGTALLFKERAKEKGIRLAVSIDPFIPRVLTGDPHRLNQILNNLLSNSIKFTDKGFVRLEALLLSETEDDVVVEFLVSDSGIGIEEGNLNYIFDNFSQASTDISSKYGGTGLGLAITKRLIQMQGGDITVESKKGVGTSFILQLPYKISKDVHVVMPYHNNTPVAIKKKYSSKRALIVEDNDINQAVLASTLKQHQLDISIVNNGQEAINDLEKGNRYDIIFMDLRMPIMNGFEATAYMRQKLHLETPIVVLTASVLRNERDRCMEIGASDYMAKPFSMTDLARTLEQFLSDSTEHQFVDLPTTSIPVKEERLALAFDISHLLELEDTEAIQQVFNLFKGKMPSYLSELSTLTTSGNWEEFLEKTHKIKGSLSSVGIPEIYQMLLLMEETVQADHDLKAVADQVNLCQNLYTEIFPAIEQEINEQLSILEAQRYIV